MTNDEIKSLLVDELTNIAPELEGEAIDPEVDLREEFDIDSMDFLNFIIAVHQILDVDIPEIDYPKLATLNGAVAYLVEALKKAD